MDFDTKCAAQAVWQRHLATIFGPRLSFLGADTMEYGAVAIKVEAEDGEGIRTSCTPFACGCAECIAQHRDEGADAYLLYIGEACGARDFDWTPQTA